MAADKVVAVAATGSGATGGAPSKDYTTRHNQAVDVAAAVIQAQVLAAGGDPSRVVKGYRILGGSKKKSAKGKYGLLTSPTTMATPFGSGK